MANIFGQIIAERPLHRLPVCRMHLFLDIHMDAHEEVVTDEIGLSKRSAFRIQTLKNQVRVVVMFEHYADNGEPVGDDFADRWQVQQHPASVCARRNDSIPLTYYRHRLRLHS